MDLWKFASGREPCRADNGAASEPQGGRTGRTMTVEAVLESLDTVNDFVTAYLEENDASMKTQMQIGLALEEAFVNIVNYAYPDRKGNADIYVGPVNTEAPPGIPDPELPAYFKEIMPEGDFSSGQAVCIALMDSGIPYNPLKRETPDISLPAADREIGGLGIFLIRKNMDDVKYTYCSGHNLLVMYKRY